MVWIYLVAYGLLHWSWCQTTFPDEKKVEMADLNFLLPTGIHEEPYTFVCNSLVV
jgi:hypothetical protein